MLLPAFTHYAMVHKLPVQMTRLGYWQGRPRSASVSRMDVGKPERIIHVEPVEEPVPVSVPVAPDRDPVPEPVPA